MVMIDNRSSNEVQCEGKNVVVFSREEEIIMYTVMGLGEYPCLPILHPSQVVSGQVCLLCI